MGSEGVARTRAPDVLRLRGAATTAARPPAAAEAGEIPAPRRTLQIANKLLSLRGCVRVTDAAGELAYEARGQFSFNPTWRLARQDAEVARLRRKILTLRPTWIVSADAGTYEIRRRLLSWRRRYYVVGGPWDGATLAGNLWDLSFQVEHRAQPLARATGKVLHDEQRGRSE